MDQLSHSVPVVSLPPPPPPHHIPRQRAVEHIFAGLQTSRLAVISAPAGYGKTVLLGECIRQWAGRSLYLQFELHPAHSVSIFYSYLHQLQPLYPEAVQCALQVYEQEHDLDPAYRELTRALATDSSPMLIVLDDYPTTFGEPVHAIVRYFLDHLPAAWRVIIASRGQTDLPLARWHAEGRVALYTEKDIRLTPQETTRLVGSILGRPVTAQETELLERDFGGWALGLRLAADSFHGKTTADILHILDQQHGLVWSVAEYLEDETMREGLLTQAERSFVQQTAILPDLGVDICNGVCDIQNAGEILDNFHRRGLYISRLDEAGTIHQYHPTFRNFLRERFYRRTGISTVRALHVRAAQIYEQHLVWSNAIAYYLKAGEYEAAANLIQEQGHRLLDRPTRQASIAYVRAARVFEPVDALLSWLDSLPEAIVQARPLLLFLKARAHNMRHEYSQARPLLEQAMERLKAPGDSLDEARAAVDWAFAAFAEGRHQEAVDLLKDVLPQSEPDPAVKAEALLAWSVNVNALSDMAGALSAAETALRVIQSVTHRETRVGLEMRVARHLAYLYRDVGDVQLARNMAVRAYELSRDDQFGGAYAHKLNLRAYMLTLIACGEVKQAVGIGNEWAAVLDALRDMNGSRASLSILQGRLAMAQQDYEVAEEYLKGSGPEHSDLTQLRLLQGRQSDALRLAHLAVAETAHHPPLVRMIAQTWLGIVESQCSNVKAGRDLLDKAVDYFNAKGLIYWKAGAELHLTWLLARLGQAALARIYLTDAMAYGARANTTHFSFWHPDVIAFACAEALATEIETEYVVRLATTQLTASQARFFQPLLRHSSEAVRRVARQLYTALDDVTSQESQQNSDRLSLNLETLVDQGLLLREGAAKLVARHHLTPREIEVFVWYVAPNIRNGYQRLNEAIASRLYLSELTVRTYVSTILKKLDVPGRDRLHLRNWAIAEKIIPN